MEKFASLNFLNSLSHLENLTYIIHCIGLGETWEINYSKIETFIFWFAKFVGLSYNKKNIFIPNLASMK